MTLFTPQKPNYLGYANLALSLYGIKQQYDSQQLQEKELALRERFGEQDKAETKRVNDMRYGKGGIEDRQIENTKRGQQLDEVKLPQSKQNFSRSVVAIEVAKMKSAGLDKTYKPITDYLVELADDPNVTKGEAYIRVKTAYPHLRKQAMDNLQKELVSGTEKNPDFMNTTRGQMLIGEIEALDQDPEGQYIDQLFPSVVEERSISEREMQIKEQEAQASLAAANKPGKLYNTVNGLLPADQAVGKMQATNGMEIITNPDGTTSVRTGVNTNKKGSENGLQAKTTTDIEKDLYNNAKRYGRVTKIKDTFQKKFQTLGTRLEVTWAKFKDFTQDVFGMKASKEEKKLIAEFATFRQDALENINMYIKEITGAQMSEKEADRIRKAMPDPGEGVFDGNSPEEFNAILDNTIKKISYANARYAFYKRTGFSGDLESIPLDSMPSIMQEWAQQRESELSQTMSKEEAEKTVMKEMPQYFGLMVK